jgi:hypothetical protein
VSGWEESDWEKVTSWPRTIAGFRTLRIAQENGPNPYMPEPGDTPWPSPFKRFMNRFIW